MKLDRQDIVVTLEALAREIGEQDEGARVAITIVAESVAIGRSAELGMLLLRFAQENSWIMQNMQRRTARAV